MTPAFAGRGAVPLHAQLEAIDADPVLSIAEKGKAACQLVRSQVKARAEIISFVDTLKMQSAAAALTLQHALCAAAECFPFRLLMLELSRGGISPSLLPMTAMR